jgi:hypothetical protein
VANQSTKLKFWRDDLDYFKPLDTHGQNKLTKIGSLPYLWFDITTMEMPGGCAAFIGVELKADLEPSKMISTGTLISQPHFIIWSTGHLISGPFQGFSSYAIQTSEQIVKEFVNDWAASQNLP